MSAKEKLPEAALEFFWKTGRIGGRRRVVNLSAEERSEQARKAVLARWATREQKATKGKNSK